MDTDLLYLSDDYLREFTATVVDAGDDGVVLDRTAFYVTGGGTPVAPTGEVGRVRVVKTGWKGKGNKRIRIEVLDG